jgi:hypothetical protein
VAQKMNITKNLQMKLTFLVFTLLVAVMVTGAVSAALEAPVDYSSAYVVENNYSFTGPASIQDAADNYETMEGYHIDVETGAHEEQVTFTKNLHIKGMGTNPEDTIIWTYSDEGATVTIAPETIVVMENLAIWNNGNGPAIINNGQLKLINCFVNGNYVENEVSGFVPVVEETPLVVDEAPLVVDEAPLVVDEAPLVVDEAPVETIVTETTIGDETEVPIDDIDDEDTSGAWPVANDPEMPLSSLATGMLMLMGGTVRSRRQIQ